MALTGERNRSDAKDSDIVGGSRGSPLGMNSDIEGLNPGTAAE